MPTLEALREWIPMGALMTAALAYVFRIEAKSTSAHKEIDRQEKRIDKLETEHKALDSRVIDQLTRIEKSVSKIEGRLMQKDSPDETERS